MLMMIKLYYSKVLLTWLPPLFGLTKTKMGFMRGEGRGFSMNGRHLDSCRKKISRHMSCIVTLKYNAMDIKLMLALF